ncbi:MAG: carbohydrate-binding protein, partial [Bacteroidota bacterium]
GNLSIQESNKSGSDFRSPTLGRLQYVDKHYLRHSGNTPDQPSGPWFFKAGADAPENMLSYNDFDGVPTPKKTWQPHQQDYSASDASAYTWKGGKGSEMLGVVRYLTEIKGVNAMSFLTFSLDGDDDTIYPHLQTSGNGKSWNNVAHDRFDVSRLDQWENIFAYGDKKGLFLHFKTQETENDQKMDGGGVGRERKLYYRLLIARFGHHLALNWNMGEENTQTNTQRKQMAQYFKDHDPYQHLVVIHTYPNQQNSVYNALIGSQSEYTGASVQTGINNVHNDVRRWLESSANSNHPWVVSNDEQGGANVGVDVDPKDRKKVREEVIWGTYLAGGTGFEFYYGYGTGCSDLTCADHRTRDQKYTDAAIALAFMQDYFSPYLPEVVNANNESSQNNDYLLRSTDKSAYVLYLPNGGNNQVNGLPNGTHQLRWFNPRNGNLGSAQSLSGSSISAPDGNDWVAFIETNPSSTPPPPPPPPPTTGLVLEEVNEVLAIEAEHFTTQSLTTHREWYLTEPGNSPGISPDPDGNHAANASGQAYLEILPDTRVTHGDPLVNGVSFSNTPGQTTVINYQVYINNPGRYFVWVRAYSTGTEDNGVHVGLDGNWPASGARMQWCSGKNNWTWESKQRTNANHCGEPQKIYLDINTPGLHTISFSMREDGFEMDKIVLSQSYSKPNGTGPAEVVYGGTSNPCADNTAPSINLTAPTQGFSYEVGESITLNASVSDADQNVSKVEFYLNGQKIGEDLQAPYAYTTQVSNPGQARFMAKATDDCGASTNSTVITGDIDAGTPNPPPPPPPSGGSERIAMVVGNANNLDEGDQDIKAKLEALGYSVETYDDDQVTLQAAQGKDLIYLSSTTLSTKITGMFREVDIPVIVCEPFLFDDMGMTQVSGGNYGSRGGMTDLVLVNNSHPISDGLNLGSMTAYTSGTTLTYGKPLNSAVVIAHLAGNTQQAGLFTYETGAALNSGTAAARRVGLWLYDASLINATPAAVSLWEQALCWAMGGCTTQPDPDPDPTPGQTPFLGSHWPIPGKIEAEHYDEGGADVAYADANEANQGGAFRDEAVDLEQTTDEGGGFNVGWIAAQEWLEYSVEVAEAGAYEIKVRVASRSAGGALHFELAGNPIGGEIEFPSTGGWQTWTTVTSSVVNLEAGQQVIRLVMDQAGFNVNYFEVARLTPTTTPLPNQTLTLGPIQDAYLQGRNRYNQSILRVEDGKRTSFLRFDLSEVEGQITSAKLRLTCLSDPGYGPMQVSLGEGSDWTEQNLSMANRPTSVRTLATLDEDYDRNQTYEWDLGSLGDLDQLNLIIEHLSGNDAAFGSKEAGSPATRPQLILEVEGGTSSGGAPEMAWLEVDARPEIDQVRVRWTVSQEQSIDYFEVQRSIDGISFLNIGVTPSQGATTQDRGYDLLDVDPLNQSHVYRVVAYGPNGFQSISPVVGLAASPVELFRIYPNPLESDQLLEVDLKIEEPEALRMFVYNVHGVELLRQEHEMESEEVTLSQEIHALQPGIYIVTVQGEGWVKSGRLVVQ